MKRGDWWGRLRCWLGIHDIVNFVGGTWGLGCVCRRCNALVPVKHQRRRLK